MQINQRTKNIRVFAEYLEKGREVPMEWSGTSQERNGREGANTLERTTQSVCLRGKYPQIISTITSKFLFRKHKHLIEIKLQGFFEARLIRGLAIGDNTLKVDVE